MPTLNVFGKQHAAKRGTLMEQCLTTPGRLRGDAGMGFYYVSNLENPGRAPVISTDSASPCLIIVVHCSNGKGALGHLAGYDDAPSIIRGVQRMIGSLSSPAILDTIVFAGGGGIAGQLRDLPSLTRQKVACSNVQWVLPNLNDFVNAYTAALYFPTEDNLALFDDDGAYTSQYSTSDCELQRFSYTGL